MKNSNIFNNLNNDIRTEIDIFLRKFRKQYGGSFPSKYYKIHNVKYKNHLFKIEFELDYDVTRTYVKILEENGVCGVIIFDDDSPQCILQSFSPKTTCAEPKLDISGNGGFMLNFMIDFVKKFNQIFKVNEILLDDLSYKLCYNLKNNELHIPLSLIYTLINGIPWYSKYGFIPYDNYKYYLSNKDIALTFETKNLQISKIIDNYINNPINSKTYKNDILLNKEWLINIFNKYKYTKDVFPIIWKEKCYLIYYLINDIYTKMNLYNFYKTTLVYKL